MAKKTLLSEGNIRKFMKLAAIEPLTENFLAEAGDEEEETMKEGYGEAMEEAEGDEMMEPAEGEEEAGEEAEEAEEAEMPAAGMVSTADFLKALETALEEVTGEDVDVSDGSKDDMGSEGDMDPDMMGEEAMDEDLYEELNESVQVVDTQAIVKEVSRRVAQRLIKESKQEQLAEALAAKIAARLR